MTGMKISPPVSGGVIEKMFFWPSPSIKNRKTRLCFSLNTIEIHIVKIQLVKVVSLENHIGLPTEF